MDKKIKIWREEKAKKSKCRDLTLKLLVTLFHLIPSFNHCSIFYYRFLFSNNTSKSLAMNVV